MAHSERFSWLQAPEVEKLVAALGSDDMRFVGGAVRDSLLGLEVHDIDVATTLHPSEVQKKLEKAAIKVIPTGIKHGTLTALINQQPFEITTLRHDKNPDGRHAEVEFHSDWREDAKRRDFTMNALYLEPNGKLHDYYGGETDCRSGIVKFIGDASQRIEEDALRMFRFFRFYGGYGKGPFDAEAIEAIKANAHLAQNLSVERIWSETKKILSSQQVVAVVKQMDRCGLLPEGTIIPADQHQMVGLVELEDYFKSRHYIRFLSLLLPNEQAAAIFAKSYKLSLKEKTNLLSCYNENIKLNAECELREIQKLLYKFGRQATENRVFLEQARRKHPKAESFLIQYKMIRDGHIPALPVYGKDLLAKGYEKGPSIGAALKKLETYWLDHDFKPTKEQLLAMLDD